MAKMVNSFALLGDEEGDDMTVLVENFAKKVDVAPVDPAASAALVREKKQPPLNQSKGQQGNGRQAKFQPSEYGVRAEGGRGRGGRGRGGPGRGGFGRNDSENYGNDQENGYRRNYGDDSKGNGYDDSYQGRGRGRGGVRGRGRGRTFNNEPVTRDEKEGSGDNTNIEDAADGWEQVPSTHSRGYGNYVNNRDEERPFRSGNRNFGGERRGYGGGNSGFRGRRDEVNYGRGEQENNEEVKVKENVNEADGNDVIVETNNANAEWDAAAAVVVTEEPKDAEGEEKAQEESVKVENPVKVDSAVKKDEEEEDENLMTLEEYEKLVAEKRKALEAQKIEERKVTADKDFEAMQLLEKKKEEILSKPEPAKLKKKDGLEKDEKSRKTLSINEFLKPADGEEFVYRRPGRGRGRGGRGGDFKTGERGGRGGDFKTGERGGRGGDFRSGERGGRGGDSRSGERGGRGADFRNGDQGGRSGDFRNGERAFGNSYPRGGRARDTPNIPIGDQSQFPVLKGAARAVEAA